MLACRSRGPHVCHVRYLQWGCWADAARQSPATRTVLRAPAPGAAASNQIIWALCDQRHLRPGRLPMRAPAALRAACSEHREPHAGQRAARRGRRRRGHRRPWRAQGHAGLHGARDDDRAVRGQARGRRLLARHHARRAADRRRHAAPWQPGAAPAALSFPFHSALKCYNEALWQPAGAVSGPAGDGLRGPRRRAVSALLPTETQLAACGAPAQPAALSMGAADLAATKYALHACAGMLRPHTACSTAACHSLAACLRTGLPTVRPASVRGRVRPAEISAAMWEGASWTVSMTQKLPYCF